MMGKKEEETLRSLVKNQEELKIDKYNYENSLKNLKNARKKDFTSIFVQSLNTHYKPLIIPIPYGIGVYHLSVGNVFSTMMPNYFENALKKYTREQIESYVESVESSMNTLKRTKDRIKELKEEMKKWVI